MLGFAVHRVVNDRGYAVVGAVRNAEKVRSTWCADLEYTSDVDVEDFDSVLRAVQLSRADVVINATGEKDTRHTDEHVRRLFAVNSRFPRLMSAVAKSLGVHFIHFSSDGVFDGRRGMYDEGCRPDAADLYGLSKFLGEAPVDGTLVLRTSLLGRGLRPNDSLLDWFLSQSGRVRGFRRVVFSGLPVNEIAHVLATKVLPRPKPLTGLFHLSANPISKYDLLALVRTAWAAQHVEVDADDTVVSDRSLDSSRLRGEISYEPPSWAELVASMRSFYSMTHAPAVTRSGGARSNSIP